MHIPQALSLDQNNVTLCLTDSKILSRRSGKLHVGGRGTANAKTKKEGQPQSQPGKSTPDTFSFFLWCCCFSYSFWWCWLVSSFCWVVCVFPSPFAWCCLPFPSLGGAAFSRSSVGWCCLVSSSSSGWCCFSFQVVLPFFPSFWWELPSFLSSGWRLVSSFCWVVLLSKIKKKRRMFTSKVKGKLKTLAKWKKEN